MTIRSTIAALIGATFCAAATAAPAKMQAIVQTGGSGAEALQLRTVDTPKPAAGEVLIKVYAAGVNPADWKRLPSEVKQPDGSVRVATPGFDVSGVIDSVGSGVTTLRPGDAVYARADRTYAQYVAVDAGAAVRKPRRLNFQQAAAAPIAGAAGYGSAEVAKLQPSQRVAIIGAAGGAGSAAVDMARAKGARIIGIGHSSQQAFLRQLGVEEFVAYDRDDVAARVRNVDAVINTVDGQAEQALGFLKRGGRLVSLSGLPTPEECSAAAVTCIQIRGNAEGLTYPDSLRALAVLADQGKYSPRVTKTFPLAEAGAAQQLLRSSDTMGKIVLSIDPQSSTR
jgi:NADPH:quinone reductase-like Zn-dependent oxidoreductase